MLKCVDSFACFSTIRANPLIILWMSQYYPITILFLSKNIGKRPVVYPSICPFQIDGAPPAACLTEQPNSHTKYGALMNPIRLPALRPGRRLWPSGSGQYVTEIYRLVINCVTENLPIVLPVVLPNIYLLCYRKPTIILAKRPVFPFI